MAIMLLLLLIITILIHHYSTVYDYAVLRSGSRQATSSERAKFASCHFGARHINKHINMYIYIYNHSICIYNYIIVIVTMICIIYIHIHTYTESEYIYIYIYIYTSVHSPGAKDCTRQKSTPQTSSEYGRFP